MVESIGVSESITVEVCRGCGAVATPIIISSEIVFLTLMSSIGIGFMIWGYMKWKTTKLNTENPEIFHKVNNYERVSKEIGEVSRNSNPDRIHRIRYKW